MTKSEKKVQSAADGEYSVAEKARSVIGKTTWVEYDGFQLFGKSKDKLTAWYSLNCCCADGMLQPGIGYATYFDRYNHSLRCDVNGPRLFYMADAWGGGENGYPSREYFVVNQNGEMFQYDQKTETFIRKGEPGKVTKLAVATDPNGVSKIIVSGELGAYCVDNGVWTALLQENTTSAVCFSQHRVFLGVKPCKILYSNPEIPWDFTSSYDEGGYVELPLNKGEIVGLVEFGEYVYVFLERAIMRLKPDGLARNFQIEEMVYSGGCIYENSMCVCGNAIFFLSENGVCRFDGKKVEYVARHLRVRPRKRFPMCQCATVGEYYLAQYYEEETFRRPTVAVRADGQDGFFTTSFIALSECNRVPVCLANGDVSLVTFGGDLWHGEERIFESEHVDFGIKKRKTLKCVCIYLQGEAEFTFKISNGEETLEWYFEEAYEKVEIPLCMRGKDFQLSFLLGKCTVIKRVALEVEQPN